jgi:hypothetical protein
VTNRKGCLQGLLSVRRFIDHRQVEELSRELSFPAREGLSLQVEYGLRGNVFGVLDDLRSAVPETRGAPLMFSKQEREDVRPGASLGGGPRPSGCEDSIHIVSGMVDPTGRRLRWAGSQTFCSVLDGSRPQCSLRLGVGTAVQHEPRVRSGGPTSRVKGLTPAEPRELIGFPGTTPPC